MSDTILVKSIEAIYPEWTAGKCNLYDGMSEVDKVVTRGEGDKTEYIVWLIGGEWRHAIGSDELRVEWKLAPATEHADALPSEGDVLAEVVNEALAVIQPFGLNGIEANIHVEFHKVIEDVIEAAVKSPHFENVKNEQIAALVFEAIQSYKLERAKIDGYVKASRHSK